MAGNSAPTIAGKPPTSVLEGTGFTFRPTAEDLDGDSLIFGVDAKPAWLTLDASTGELTGVPGTADVGVHSGIVMWVSDGIETTLLPAFDLTVIPESRAGSQPPVISGTPTGDITTGTSYDFIPVASDPDGDALTFAIANRPAWTTFDAQTGRLSGSPGLSDVGVYQNVIINVSDGISSAALPPFVIVVNPPPSSNSPPTITGTPALSVLEGAAYSFQPIASDPDGDPLTFMIINGPAWAVFDTSTGALSGTPGSAC